MSGTIRYEVVNPKMVFGKIALHQLFVNHPTVVIPVIISPFVEMPFLNNKGPGHMLSGSINS